MDFLRIHALPLTMKLEPALPEVPFLKFLSCVQEKVSLRALPLLLLSRFFRWWPFQYPNN